MRTPSSTLLLTMRMNDAFGGATSVGGSLTLRTSIVCTAGSDTSDSEYTVKLSASSELLSGVPRYVCFGSEKNPDGYSIAWKGAGFTCKRCERLLPTRVQFFYKNAGFLFWRYTNDVGGVRCRKCMDSDFWEASIISGLFGWFGVISLPLNPFMLGINFLRYMGTIGMPGRLPEGEIDGPTRERIAEDLPNVYRDLERNQSHVDPL